MEFTTNNLRWSRRVGWGGSYPRLAPRCWNLYFGNIF